MVQVVADCADIHCQAFQRVENARGRLGEVIKVPGWIKQEYFQDAVDRVGHVETMGKVMVDHVAVALLYRCNIRRLFCWIL